MKRIFQLLILLAPIFTFAQQGENFFPKADWMTPGIYYYPEHWKENQWERDIKKMKELGFEFVHMSEFAWAKMEPEEGKYDFTWLDKCVSLADKNGMKVVLCTPSPCPPAWLQLKHPEILTVNNQAQRIEHGGRMQGDINHPKYKEYIQKIVLQLTQRYGKDKRVMGWQIDNEPHYASLYNYSDHAEKSFRIWLKGKYKSIDSLNFSWGNHFWSINYNNFDQIKIPNSKIDGQGASPHSLLDFQLFNAAALAEGLRFQAKLLRANILPTQWVTTNFAYYKFLPSVDLFLNQKDFDFASHTMYLLSTYLDSPQGNLSHRLGSGLGLSFSAEFAQSMNGYTGIMEIQPGQINWGAWNSQPLPGAVHMWLWHAFSVGDRFISAYRFRQPLRGGEHYHAGIMETDGITVARGGQEFVKAIQEIKSLRTTQKPVAKLPKDVQSRKTAFLWKQANLFDMTNEPHTKEWDTWKHYFTYYESLKTIGSAVTFLQETDEFDPKVYPFMVAPAFQLVDAKLVGKWKKYVEAGGHLILSCRAGQKDQLGHLWEGPLYQPILELIGAKVSYWDQLQPGTSGKIKFMSQLFDWHVWSDVLQPNAGTEILATHQDQFYAGAPTVVRKKYGKGSVTYIGTWSNEGELERNVIRKVYEEAGATILDLPRYLFSEYRDGLRIATNYTSFEFELEVPKSSKILFGESFLKPGNVCVWKD